MNSDLAKWILSLMVILSTYMVGRKNIWGWVVGILASLGWIYNTLLISEYQLAFTAGTMLLVRIYSAYKWLGK